MIDQTEWERVRSVRTNMLSQVANDILVRADQHGIKISASDIDGAALTNQIEWIVSQHIEACQKHRNIRKYADDTHMSAAEICAFFVFSIMRNSPIRTHHSKTQHGLKTVEACHANAMLAWRTMCSLLRISKIRRGRSFKILRCLQHFADGDAVFSASFVSIFGVVMMESICDAWGDRKELECDFA